MDETFATAAELIDRLRPRSPAAVKSPAPDEVWAPDWRDRCRRFVEPFMG